MKKQNNNLKKRKLISIVIIDNYDSFTYNLVQFFGRYAHSLFVFKNDEITIKELERINPTHIIISAGPGNTTKVGICKKVILHFYKKIPILGICLGHQCIADVFGAKIVHAPSLFHGKVSLIEHNHNRIFSGLKKPFFATRYHSLIVSKYKFPAELEISAVTIESKLNKNEIYIIMALQHKKYPLYGLQFHPESIMTKEGEKILLNFIITPYKK